MSEQNTSSMDKYFVPFDFRSPDDDYENMKAHVKAKKVMSYGIKYLDDATGGIRCNELVVIGGRTGIGKTETVTHIAQTNAKAGRKVFFFALEAELGEITNRLIYKEFARLYYASNLEPKEHLMYRRFIDGEYKLKYKIFIEKAKQYVFETYSTLHIMYRDEEGFCIKKMEEQIELIAKTADLIIIDHLHHFDSSEINEVMAIKNIVKKIRDITIVNHIPIILVAHLRKDQAKRKERDLVPDIEEFYGSSEISKEAVQVITFAPYDNDKTERDYWLIPNLIRVVKFRKDGSVRHYVGKHHFNIKGNTFDNKYVIGKLENNNTEFIPLSSKIPSWCTC